ncbi:MAG TPA: FAD-binding oxidoreductase [Steroidobacteraceae bacterium]
MKRREFIGATLAGGAAAALPGTALAAAKSKPAGVPAVQLSGAATFLEEPALKQLAGTMRGSLILPTHEEYETARRVWNPMIDRRPALIARCAEAKDVVKAVNFARERELLVAVRSGGHSFPGHSTCDGGMVIDLSSMRKVRVDAGRKTATVEAGAWVSDVDSKTLPLGLATTMGQISDTGVAGLTLGGGYGWLSRKLGLACDNLIWADIVTPDGKFQRVSANENEQLFWAIRGGGGNFGVATSFEYRLHKQQQQVYAAYISYPVEHLRAVMELYQETTATGPRDLSLDLSLEASDKGEPLVAVYACHSGDPAEGPALIAPFDRVAKPFQSVHGPDTYERVQHQSDGPHLSKSLHYIKAGLVREFKPELIETLQREFRPSGEIFIYMQNASGAVGDVAPQGTAFWNRKSMANLMILGTWRDPANTEKNRAAIRAAWEKIAPFTEGFYTNLSDADAQSTHRNYGGNYARLSVLKRKFDPANMLRLNSNITPAI